MLILVWTTKHRRYPALRLTSGLLIAALVGVPGCRTWRPATQPLRDGAAVTVRYNEPRDVQAITASGDSINLRDVRELRGQIIRAVPDTMFVRVMLGRRPPRGTPTENAVVAVTQTPGVSVSEQTVSPGKTLLLLVGIGLAVIAVYFLSWAVACPSPCLS